MEREESQINFNGEVIFPHNYQVIYNSFDVIKVDFKFKFNFKGLRYTVKQLAEIDKTLGLTYEDYINDYIRDLDEDYRHFFFGNGFESIREENQIEDNGLSKYLETIEIISVVSLV